VEYAAARTRSPHAEWLLSVATQTLGSVVDSERNGGVIVTASTRATVHRDLLLALALQYRLPTIYPFRYFTANGGLASYGPDNVDIYARAATYVDCVLRGEKPADLPVQAPIKYELHACSWKTRSDPAPSHPRRARKTIDRPN
jgi:ABC transporter substrate binding protein